MHLRRCLRDVRHLCSGSNKAGDSVVNARLNGNAAADRQNTYENRNRQESVVPSSQIGRVVHFGGLAVEVGASIFTRMVRQSLTGSSKPESKISMLTENEISKIVALLCRVRGAALKFGQVISIQDSSLVDPKFQQIFERVRNSADAMPFSQAEVVLTKELGSDWRKNFKSFDEKPFAAASIGQVHNATLSDQRKVAVKIQYPGVAKSISSDIANISALVKFWDIVPKGLYVDNMLRVIRMELSNEVDYKREADCIRTYRKFVGNDPDVYVPNVIDDLSTGQVLTTEFAFGVPIDKLSTSSDQALLNKVGSAMLRVTFSELFVYRYMQTDPNWSNYIYDAKLQKINLLDFGAARSFDKSFVSKYGELLEAAAEGNRQGVLEKSRDIGFLTGYESSAMEKAHVDAVMILGETLRVKEFDFGKQQSTRDISSMLPVMAKDRLTPPPDETYSLHRKMAGIFLLLTHLRSVVPCREIFYSLLAKSRST